MGECEACVCVSEKEEAGRKSDVHHRGRKRRKREREGSVSK